MKIQEYIELYNFKFNEMKINETIVTEPNDIDEKENNPFRISNIIGATIKVKDCSSLQEAYEIIKKIKPIKILKIKINLKTHLKNVIIYFAL